MYADESAAVLLFNMIMMMIIKIIVQENTFSISENVQVCGKIWTWFVKGA